MVTERAEGWYVSDSDQSFIIAWEDGEWVAPTGVSWNAESLPGDLVRLVKENTK